MNFTGNAKVGGSVVLLGNSSLDLSGNANVTDRVFAKSLGQVVEHGNATAGQVVLEDLTVHEAAVLDFANIVSNQTPTQTFDEIKDDMDIFGNGELNVIRVKGGIHLSGNRHLRLHGTANDQFVFLVDQGDIQLSGNAGVNVVDGASSRKVMFLASGGQSLSISGNGKVVGTFMIPEGPISITGNGQMEGAILAEGKISIHGNGFTFTPSAWCPEISIPGPSPSPSDSPSESPSPDPSPSVSPSETPSPSPSVSPSTDPSSSPSPEPSADPSASPSPSPTSTTDPGAGTIVEPSPSPSPTSPTDSTSSPGASPTPAPTVCSGVFCSDPILGT
jgi:hypothetical protein